MEFHRDVVEQIIFETPEAKSTMTNITQTKKKKPQCSTHVFMLHFIVGNIHHSTSSVCVQVVRNRSWRIVRAQASGTSSLQILQATTEKNITKKKRQIAAPHTVVVPMKIFTTIQSDKNHYLINSLDNRLRLAI